MSAGKTFGLLLALGVAFIALGAKGASLKFISPVKRGKIGSKFGSRDNPFGEGTEIHNGVDVDVPQGTNVYAIAPGLVTSSYFTDKGGKQLIITHDNGYKSGYAHLYFPLVRLGDHVERGQLIAQSGKTGNVTGSHLHFTLRDQKGKFIDPQRYIKFTS